MRRQSEAAAALWLSFGKKAEQQIERIQSDVALRLPPHSKERRLAIFGFMRVILISLLKFYKAVISPWLPPSCRFVPTCSEYAREAIERHGALRGSGMAVWRLLRCQPFCVGGYDPVK